MHRHPLFTLTAAEVTRFTRSARAASVIPLGLVSIPCTLWPFIGDPLIPAFLAVWIVTEPLFGNMLYGSPRELDAVALLPVAWGDFVRAKNIAAVVTCCGLLAALIAGTLFVLPERPTASSIATSSLVFLTSTLFLLDVGNRHSLRTPRRRVRWDLEGIAAATLHVLAGAACLGVQYLLLGLPGGIVLILGLCVWAIVSWHRHSVPATASRLAATFHQVCSNTQMPLLAPAWSNDLPADEQS